MVSTSIIVGCAGKDDTKKGAESAPDSSVTTTTALEYSGDASSRFCELAGELITPGQDESPEELRAFYERFDAQSDEFVSEAPPELNDDVAVFVAGVRALKSELEAAGYQATAVDPEQIQELSNAEFPLAGSRIVTYTAQVCDAE